MKNVYLTCKKEDFALAKSITAKVILAVVFLLCSKFTYAQTSCTNAIAMSINGSCQSGSVSDNTQNAPMISGCSAGVFRKERWFSFNVTGGPQTVTITADAANRNLYLQLIAATGPCGTLTEVACSNADNNDNTAQIESMTNVLSNGLYYIKVVNAGANSLNMTLNSLCITAPSSCATPSAQPTGLTLSSTNATTIVGNFTAASPAPNNYLIVRSTSATAPSPGPINGINYNTGDTINSATVIAVSSSTTFTDATLVGNTKYYYYIYSVNDTACSGTAYNTTSPLTNSATTCTAVPNTVSTSSVTSSSFVLNWAFPTGGTANTTTYSLQVSTNAGFTTNITGSPFSFTNPTSSTTISGLTAGTTYYYRILANNGCSSAYVTGNVTTSTACVPPSITSQPTALTLCSNAMGTFSITATGATTYQWYRNGVLLSNSGIYTGTTTNTLTVTNPSTTDSGSFTCILNNGTCSTTSAAASLTVNNTPVITTQPIAPAPICTGTSTTTITVAANYGTTYQWRKNGINLTNSTPYSGTNTAMLTITNPSISENGALIDVVITNAGGCTTISNSITLTINSTPTITSQPSSQTVCSNQIATFNVVATNATTYQWYKNGIALTNTGIYSGVNTASLSISNPTTTDAGNFTCVLNTTTCAVTTNIATLSVNNAPSIVSQPVSVAPFCEGTSSPTFTVTATNATTYQWRKNGVNLTNTAPYSGVTTATLTLTNPSYTENGAVIDVVISNAAGCTVISAQNTLVINPIAIISQQPLTTNSCTNSTTNLYITATGVTTYQWQRNGINLTNTAPYSGVTTTTLSITNPATTESGNFTCILNGATTCTVTSNTAVVTINSVPVITVQPVAPASFCSGMASATLSVTATGATTYQWRKNGVNLTNTAPYSGVTTATLSITNPAFTENGAVLDVVVRNAAGCFVISTPRTLSLIQTAAITTQPIATTTCTNSTATFTIAATNATTYQWQRNGVNLTNVAPYSGATSATLTITSPAAAIAGNFTCIINSGTCPVTSNSVALTIIAPPSAPSPVTPSTGTSICSGSSINLTGTSTGNTIVWYTASTGGSSIGTSASGANFSVSPTVNSTYYAETLNSIGCLSTTRTATALISMLVISPVIEFTQNGNDHTQVITACGVIGGGGQNDLDIYSGNPGTGSTYQWEISYDNINWINGPGPTSTTTQYVLNPLYTDLESAPGVKYIRLKITYGGCFGYSNVNTLTVTGSNTLTPGSIGSDQYFCGATGDPAAFTSTGTPTGGLGTYTYQWESSTDNVTFTFISGATSATYNSPVLSQTTYFRRSAISGGCRAISNTIVVTIGQPTLSVASSATAMCFMAAAHNTPLTYSVTSGTPTTYSITWSSTPTNSFVAVTNATLTASQIQIAVPANTVAGTYTGTLSVKNAGGCASPNYTFTVIVNAIPTTPIISSTILPTCSVNSGTINLSGLPTGTWTLNQTGTATNSIGGSISTAAVSGLISGTYAYSVTNSNGCTSPTTTNTTITPLVTTTWSAGAWSNGTPTIDKNIIFNGAFTTSVNLSGCSCQVNSGVVTIAANTSLTITNSVNVSGGSLIVKNGGSLIQTNNSSVNTGNIALERTSSVRGSDYVYWSSPVASFSAASISPATDSYYIWKWNPSLTNYNGGQGYWQSGNETMSLGKGYIVKGPDSYNETPTPFTATFTGIPNNGIIQPTISRGTYTGANYAGTNGATITSNDDNWNLLGNPYPSAIDAVAFLAANTNIAGNVRLWTHGTEISQGGSTFYASFGYNYNVNDYINYNGTGSTPPGFNGKIGAGQGFFVIMNESTAPTETVTFNNSMRNASYSNSQFYKTTNTAQTVSEKNRIWISLLNANQQAVTTLVGYVTGATLDQDRLFDAEHKIDGSMSIYSMINDNTMIIQGRPVPFDNSDIVPLGATFDTAGTYTLALGQVDGLFSNSAQNIYLEDTFTGVTHDMRATPYSFTSQAGTFNGRFKLRYNGATLSNSNTETTTAVAYINHHQLNIQTSTSIKKITLHDVRGQLMTTYIPNDSTTHFESEFNYANGVYIASIELENGTKITQKVMN
jgi:hypothetical protein